PTWASLLLVFPAAGSARGFFVQRLQVGSFQQLLSAGFFLQFIQLRNGLAIMNVGFAGVSTQAQRFPKEELDSHRLHPQSQLLALSQQLLKFLPRVRVIFRRNHGLRRADRGLNRLVPEPHRVRFSSDLTQSADGGLCLPLRNRYLGQIQFCDQRLFLILCAYRGLLALLVQTLRSIRVTTIETHVSLCTQNIREQAVVHQFTRQPFRVLHRLGGFAPSSRQHQGLCVAVLNLRHRRAAIFQRR